MPLLITAQTRAPGDPEAPATVNTQQFWSRQLSLTVLPMTARTTMNSWSDTRAFTTWWNVGDHWHFERWPNTFTQPWIFFKVCIYIVITHRPHPLFYWVTNTLSRSISFWSNLIKLPSMGLWSSHLQLSVLLFIWIHHQISPYAVAIFPEAPILHF